MHQKERATLKKFGNRVAQLRNKRSMTQEQLAEATNLDRMTIAFIENGRRWPRVETLLALSEVLNVQLDEFFRDL